MIGFFHPYMSATCINMPNDNNKGDDTYVAGQDLVYVLRFAETEEASRKNESSANHEVSRQTQKVTEFWLQRGRPQENTYDTTGDRGI